MPSEVERYASGRAIIANSANHFYGIQNLLAICDQ
jgi:hypothetical protein